MSCDHSKGAANTVECMSSFIGHKLVGMFTEYVNDGTNTWCIYDCGSALVFRSNGSYWAYGKDNVRKALDTQKQRLSTEVSRLKNILNLAGEKELDIILHS
jgi:hypothetical protein